MYFLQLTLTGKLGEQFQIFIVSQSNSSKPQTSLKLSELSQETKTNQLNRPDYSKVIKVHY